VITEIAEAIMNKFRGSTTFKSALSGGLYFQQAPQEDVSSPYGVFYIMGVLDEEIFGTADNNLREITVQFSLFNEIDDGGESIGLLVKLLTDLYDWCKLVIDGYSSYKCQREMIGPILYTDEIWQGTIDYAIGMCKE
jgi:hypothetical protein